MPAARHAAAAEVMREPATALVVHAREELGIDPDDLPSAIGAASLSLVCFLFGAVLPLIPWFVGSGNAATWASIIIGVLAAAVVGALVGKFAERPLWLTITRQVAIVLAACAITYAIGELVGVNVNG